MKKSQSDEREELNVVYSYLKILTLTGGLAITSLTLIGHILITEMKENLSPAMAVKQPAPIADITEATVKLIPAEPQDAMVIAENQSDVLIPGEVISEELPHHPKDVHPITANEVPVQVTVNPQPEESVVATVEASSPSAQIDVYPAGYGTFRILIESDTTDHFTATLTDILHQEIVTEQYEVSRGKNEFLLDSGEIPRGDYVLKVSNGVITSQKRVTLK